MYLNLCLCRPEVIIFLNHSSPYLLKPGLSLNLEFICLAFLTGHWAPGICAVPGFQKTHPHGAFLEVWTRVLMLACCTVYRVTFSPTQTAALRKDPLLPSGRELWLPHSPQPSGWSSGGNPGLKGTCSPKLAILHVSCQDLKMCWLVCRSCILDS